MDLKHVHYSSVVLEVVGLENGYVVLGVLMQHPPQHAWASTPGSDTPRTQNVTKHIRLIHMNY